MKQQPTLTTARLTLRPFTLADAPAVQELAGAYEVALNTLTIPHPYPEGGAEQWIGGHQEEFDNDRSVHFAIDDGRVAGVMSLMLREDQKAELGYWIAVQAWGRGYATEAGEAVLRYGFEERGLVRVYASYFARNPASARVMQKLGMVYEGTLRRHVRKWNEDLDMGYYGILREEWLSSRR